MAEAAITIHSLKKVFVNSWQNSEQSMQRNLILAWKPKTKNSDQIFSYLLQFLKTAIEESRKNGKY